MKPAVEEVVQKALELGDEERAEVAARLLDSLEQAHGEMESGAVKGVTWEELQERLLRDRRGS